MKKALKKFSENSKSLKYKNLKHTSSFQYSSTAPAYVEKSSYYSSSSSGGRFI